MAAWRSSKVTCQPRAARLAAVAQPARPAPITSASRTLGRQLGRANQGLPALLAGPLNWPLSTSHLRPMPGTRRMLKPAALSPRRTSPALQ